jgi:hypothetical protein
MRSWVVLMLSLDLVTDACLCVSEPLNCASSWQAPAAKPRGNDLRKKKKGFEKKTSSPLLRISSLHLQETLEDPGSLRIGRVKLPPVPGNSLGACALLL